MATTLTEWQREHVAAALTASGYDFTEAEDVAPAGETPVGCWSLVAESGDDDPRVEGDTDRACEVSGTVIVTRWVPNGESVYDAADAMIDAVRRSLETYTPASRQFTHPTTGRKAWLLSIAADLYSRSHVVDGARQVATVAFYPVLHYRRERGS